MRQVTATLISGNNVNYTIRDPKYDDWDEAERTCAARGLFLCRILRALDHLSGPIKRAVANFFANKGYMDRGDFPELFPVKNT